MKILRVETKKFMAACVFSILLLTGSHLAHGQTETVLFNFSAGNNGAYDPVGGVITDASGNLYGTAAQGGEYNAGIVFELTPKGKETVLHNFEPQVGNDGGAPGASLIMDKEGNLYGTTVGGGLGVGAVFKLTKAAAWAETTLHSFGSTATDGFEPRSNLVMDASGNLYGTTELGGGGAYGGGNGGGAVYKVTPEGVETILYAFCSEANCVDGMAPFAGLLMDAKGDLYGTTVNGGTLDQGVVFKLTPAGTETVLHSFDSQKGDGYSPYGGLVRDKEGNFYGTTLFGGAYSSGAVYKLTGKTENLFYSFGSQSGDGNSPYDTLVIDSSGNLYGTTEHGGTGNCASGCGTVFMITPGGSETVLWDFGGQGKDDGAYPYAGVYLRGGDLYGTTISGGPDQAGTVYKVVP
jgi:uncharacterized repeat protein (TIGR03803 family)